MGRRTQRLHRYIVVSVSSLTHQIVEEPTPPNGWTNCCFVHSRPVHLRHIIVLLRHIIVLLRHIIVHLRHIIVLLRHIIVLLRHIIVLLSAQYA